MNFLNRCAVRANNGGSSSFTLTNAVPGFYTPPLCLNPSAVDGATYRYFAVSDDGTQHEEGDGVWDASESMLTRANVRNSSNDGGSVYFSAAPVVYMGGPTADDISASSLDIVEDFDTQQFGFGVADTSELQPGRVTIAPTAAGFGDDLVTNGGFVGNADSWTLGGGWAYDSNKITYTADAAFGGASQTVATMVAGKTYQISVDVSGYVAGALAGAAGGTPVDFGVTGDGTYTIEVVAGTDPLSILADSEDFAGSVTNVQLRLKLKTTAVSFLHEDKSPALTVNTAATGGADPVEINVNSSNEVSIGATHFGLKNLDNDFTVDLSSERVDHDLTLEWPNTEGVVSVFPFGGVDVASLPADPSVSYQFSTFVYDASVAYSGANIGTVVVGGGSNFVPVYFDFNTSEWKIG